MISHLMLNDITVHFGSTKVLNRIKLQLPSNGILALVGPNGAGKSTLLDVLSGFINTSGGCINSRQLTTALTKKELQSFFVRLHQRLVIPHDLTVYEFLHIAKQPKKATSPLQLSNRIVCTEKKIKEFVPEWLISLLLSANLQNSFDKKIGELSYGQKRIVAIGAVLLSSKSGILLDEPMAGLSSATRKVALEVIKKHGAKRLILITEHDLDTVKKMADELIVLVGGQIAGKYSGNSLAQINLLGHFLDSNTK
ncbi:ATP-binding cassette domain-containing protein [Nitrosomonas marina]|uniref:Branched-chain amino acid transport system ATP-binding protein/urea transport system ATP-binding protein n=1 Tax=Nitrosomonas marina TaxID=917 RepID=A0A1H8G2U8_9PROT|nr:ATP-binding cassette domain-containing protein [Nitrosomonas marina]SEN38326.1 branched-chain amino acid transport system ATP-binding protein/urea transport system ATP-binding protein [Nitrosomonas marina]